MRILVVGASGYIGGRLVPRLVALGHDLVLVSRDARSLEARFPGTRVMVADLLDPDTLPPALEGVEVAYYLANAMGNGEDGVAERNRVAAGNFARAAAAAGLGRIVYLGSLGDDAPDLAHHLASRHGTGRELASAGVPVTEFRAGVIIGSGSAPFEILRHLVERQPVMIPPRWVNARCQPIGMRNVLEYLAGALEHPEVSGIVEIGGPDVLSYREMMGEYARLRGLRRLVVPLPILAARPSARWVSLISPVPTRLARPLIESLRADLVVRDPAPATAFDVRPFPFRTALERAIDRTHRHDIETTWFDALATPDKPGLTSMRSREGMIIERRERDIPTAPRLVFAEVERLGGRAGWPYGNVLWRIRGLMDRAVGGVGMRLGRRDPDHVRVGDAVDFWRVEEVHRPRLLRLRAEMRVPGRAWLQYEVVPNDGGCRLVQEAFFEPKGLPGLAYWYVLYPVHGMIFRGTVRVLGDRAVRAAARATTEDGPDPS